MRTPSVLAADASERVGELLARMTLAQKIGQMTQPERLHITPAQVREHHIGSVLSGAGSCPGDNRPADWVTMADAYWAASMAEGEDRLPIPILYGVDAVHGHANVLGATIFPHNIGLGAAADPDLVERIARATACEVLATGVDWTFAPTLAVAQDVRWGRTYESFSQDPALVTAYARRAVAGLQGAGVIACAKHWVGDGGTAAGVDQGNARADEAAFRRLHVAPYRAALDAGVMTVMVSLSSWNGTKCHAHRYLIQDVLKRELGFRGFVVSDWNGVDPLAERYADAVAAAVNAGVDMFMVPERWREFVAALHDQVARGVVPVARIDDAVARILWVKLASGLFDRPRPAARRRANGPDFGSPSHRALAREAVRKSLVLLKHERNLLPLDRRARIAVAGRNAHDRGRQCGGFTVEWQGVSGNDAIVGGTSIWEAIRAVAPNAVLECAAPDGCTGDSSRTGAPGADIDVAVVVVGERPYAEGVGDIRKPTPVRPGANPLPAGPGVLQPYGDTLELASLHPEDLATIRAFTARGVPVVTVMLSGRPLVVNAELEASDAFVAAWLPGSEGGGVADVLFGDYGFTGRLPFAWPRAMPDASPKANPSTGTQPCSKPPLFPVGYGLDVRDGAPSGANGVRLAVASMGDGH